MSNEKPTPGVQRVNRVVLAVLGVWLSAVGLALLPNDWRSIRAAGAALDWWYVGIAAPLLIVALILYSTNRKRFSD
jgi:putative solute:sodium symporter small subunit